MITMQFAANTRQHSDAIQQIGFVFGVENHKIGQIFIENLLVDLIGSFQTIHYRATLKRNFTSVVGYIYIGFDAPNTHWQS